MKKWISLFGVGYFGEKIYYQLSKKGVKIKYVYDNFQVNNFHGMKVIRIEDHLSEIENELILISSSKYYSEIKKQLEGYGLHEFDDFIIGDSYARKIVVVNANCYGTIIKTYLRSSQIFSNKYYIYDTKPVHMLNVGEKIDVNLLKHCDLFIHQDIREDNPYSYFASDKYVKPMLKEECVSITIPNLYGMGKAFFPQSERTKNINNDKPFLRDGMFPFSDQSIDFLVDDGKNIEEIIDCIKSGMTYKKEDILKNFNDIFAKFIVREKNWDIKIIGYIQNNYHKRKMFYDNAHPTNELLELIAKRILERLCIFEEKLKCISDLGAWEMPIYPEVREALNLQYGGINEIIRINSPLKLSSSMGVEEFVRQYVYWCF